LYRIGVGFAKRLRPCRANACSSCTHGTEPTTAHRHSPEADDGWSEAGQCHPEGDTLEQMFECVSWNP
jgi:hypothetical protein